MGPVAEDDGGSGIKVTDRRMFTPEGDLREDYRHLEDEAAPAAEPSDSGAPSPPTEEAVPPAAEPRVEATGEDAGGRVEVPHTPGSMGTPGFLDLVSALAEPIPIYLGDAQLPDGESAENLDAARFYIDLLEVLRSKTAGNLSAQENAVLEDLLYQLRMRYVRKQG